MLLKVSFMAEILTEEEIMNEVHIIKKAQKNSREFSPLYKKYFPVIFKYIFRRTNDEEATADLTSQVFLKALIHLYKWKNEGIPFSAWLYRIALNECREYYRKSNKVQFVVFDEKSKSELQHDLQLDYTYEKFEKIKEILKTLSAEDIQVIELRYFEKLSFKEIGYLTGITENNAKVRLYRIIQKIRKKYDHEI